MIEPIYIPIYNFNILVVLDVTTDDWNKFINNKNHKKWLTDDEKKMVAEDISSIRTCDGSTTFLDSGDYVIFVRDSQKHGNIAHEVFHVVNKALALRGLEHNASAESWAYLIGYVTDQVYELIDKNKKG